ncbi:MAG: hypothetical protein ACE5HN_09065 [Nitrospiria bacterium]
MSFVESGTVLHRKEGSSFAGGLGLSDLIGILAGIALVLRDLTVLTGVGNRKEQSPANSFIIGLLK